MIPGEYKREKTFPKINSITLVGLSHWIVNCAKQSTLFKHRKIIKRKKSQFVFRANTQNISRNTLNIRRDIRRGPRRLTLLRAERGGAAILRAEAVHVEAGRRRPLL